MTMDRETAGTVLQEKRVSLGLSLDDVARATLLRKSVLESLEAGGPPEPNGFFRSYARRYAGFLGLNGDEIVGSFAALRRSETPESADTRTPIPTRERRRKGVSAFTRKRSLIPVVLVVVVALATAVVLLSRPWSTGAPAPGGQVEPSNSSPESSLPSTTAPDSTPVTPSGSETTSTTLPTGSIMTLRFAATTQRAWLEITADGRVAFSGNLRPGDSTQVNGSYIVVNFGNAMYTQISINGADQGLVSSNKTVMTVEYGSPPATP
ncbi:MAG: helix-turn-helix domain-containing protein [Candidatus Cryosericum sp.]|jgi:cytoskeletal protein RodZ